MQVSENKVVSIHYTLTNEKGEILDTSSGGEPLAYLHGMGNIIPGLEKALTGKSVGDSMNVTIPPEEAYGLRDESRMQTVPRSAFEGIERIEPGMQFQAQSEHGPVMITVAAVEGDTVTVDGNHPLAGETLVFAVEITDIRDASPEELAHGHAHGEGGHQH